MEETWAQLHRRPRDGYVKFINSGNFIVKKPVFDRIGGFDERLSTDEDADLGLRLGAAGFKIYESHDVAALHLRNPKSLVGFFRKELWRGSGMFRMHKRTYVDRVFLATLVHTFLVALGVLSALFLELHAGARVAVVLLALLFVPSLAVCYRFAESGKVYRPLRSLLLYCIFFAAKVVAMVTETIRGCRRQG